MLATVRRICGRIMHSQTVRHSQWDKGWENNSQFASPSIRRPTIDYPVLQHPTDNYYYLNYNLDGSKGYPGCIYTEDYNKKDFTDPVTVMYGHNMKNGTMFAGLHRYSDSLYMEEHPYVYIYTEEGLLVYEVFSAHEYSDAHILYNHDYTQSTEFEGYLEDIRNARDMGRVLREDVEVTEESRILTLSTCIANKPNNRFLVQGVLLNGEQ